MGQSRELFNSDHSINHYITCDCPKCNKNATYFAENMGGWYVKMYNYYNYHQI